MLRTAICCLAMLAMATTNALGQVELKHKLIPGVYQRNTSSKTTQTLTIGGAATETGSETVSVSKFTIGKPDDAGKTSVEEAVESLQVTVKVAGTEYFFDSANPDKKGTSGLEVLRDVHKQIAKSKTVIVYGRDQRVEKIEFDENQFNGLADQIKSMVQSQIDPDYLKEVANGQLDRIPGKPVQVGDSWESTTKTNFGAGQLMTFQNRHTYEGVVEKDGKKLDKITTKVTSVDFDIVDSPLPLKLKSHELKVPDSASTAHFDRQLGRFVDAKGKVQVKGKLTFETNGMELPAELDLTLESEVTE